jgi:hypothetical protein
MRLAAIVVLASLVLCGGARAADDDLSCRNGSFPSDEKSIGLARVEGAGRLNFLQDVDGCPNDEARCRQRAYVVGGDELLTGRSHGPYVCAFYANRVGGSAGWVPSSRLTALPVDVAPPLSAWTGHWANGDDTIDLTAKAGALVADGEAYWPSANPPLSERPGGPNTGELSGTARPKGNHVVFADPDPTLCSATLTLVGGLLVVADNNACGGMNVSFSGVYRRKK